MKHGEKVLCFSGHRQLPKGEVLADLEIRLRKEMEKAVAQGYNTFLFGGALGWDMLCGAKALEMRDGLGEMGVVIKVIAVIPYGGQADAWTGENRFAYDDLLRRCDDVVILSQGYEKDCFKKRNRYMVAHSEKLICYFDGRGRSGTGQTVGMAMEKGLEIVHLHEAVQVQA